MCKRIYYVKDEDGDLSAIIKSKGDSDAAPYGLPIITADINSDYIPVCKTDCPSCDMVEMASGHVLYNCHGGKYPVATEEGWPCLPIIRVCFMGIYKRIYK